MPEAQAAPAGTRPEGRDGVRRLLDLFVLTGFAITQPLLHVTGESPDSFVYWRAERLHIVLFLLIVMLCPTLVLWLAEQVVGLVSRTAQRWLHIAFVAGLLTLLAIQVAKAAIPDRGYSLLALGLVIGVAAAALVVRSTVARTFMRYLTPAPLVFALLFVVASPAGKLVTSATPQAEVATSAPSGTKKPPVVMIVFDEFPAISLLGPDGLVDERVFPNFARLQKDSTWFRQATGISGFTPVALPAMLNGRYPQRELPPSYLTYRDNLFTLLGSEYSINASESISELCPPSVCRRTATVDNGRETGLRPILREAVTAAGKMMTPLKIVDDPAGEQFVEEPAEKDEDDHAQDGDQLPVRFRWNELRVDQPARFTSFLESLKPADRPTLRFLHLLLPHIPYRYLPSGATYPRAARKFTAAKKLPGDALSGAELSFRQRHLLQLAYTDGLIGEVVDTLKAQGSYDESLVIVTADHGINFTAPLSIREFEPANAHELTYVPTFVKLPGQTKGVVDDRNWEHVDLLPTIADVLDVPVPWRVDGMSGLGPDLRTRDEKFWYEKAGKRETFSATSVRPKLLRGLVGQYGRPELGVDGLFAWGPHGDLVGRRVADLSTGPAAPVTARLNVGPRTTVEPGSHSFPAMVWGGVRGAAVGTPIAVAVNGTIGAVPLVFPDATTDAAQLAGVVPDRLYRAGANEIALFVVETEAETTRLRPMTFVKK